jgi:hypothetical protein
MAHDHPHSCGPFRSYLAEQLLAIFVVAVLGLIGILMYRNGQLGYILALRFHSAVLIGSVAVLVLVVVRAVTLCRGTSEIGCHSPDLSWACSRMIILSFPVGLFLIGVPNSGFSQDRIRVLLGGDDGLTGHFADAAYRNGTVSSFEELSKAANDEGNRDRLTGQTAILEGRIRRIDSRQFTLFHLKMTCCAADVVPLKVRIVLKSGTLSGLDDFDWVRMTGRIQFVQAPNSKRYIPVILVEDIRHIRRIEPKGEYE